MIETQLPPYDMNAEEGVNGSLLIDSDCYSQVKYLIPEDFFSETNRLIFRACKNIMDRQGKIDQITVAEELNRAGKLSAAGGAAYLSNLIATTPTSLDIEYYADIVKRLSVSRSIVTAASQIGSLGFEASPDVEGTLKTIEQIIVSIKKNAGNRKNDIVTPNDMATRMIDMIKQGETSLPWGFVDLDELTGGVYPQDYIVVGARPSVGKTQFMLDAANNIALRGKKVLFVSAEMTINPVLERHIAKSLGISIWNYRKRDINSQYWQENVEPKYMVAAADLGKIPIYYLFDRRSSDSIWDNARKMKESVGLDIIFVDYLQLLSDCYRGGRENHSVAVGMVSHNLKAITTDLNIPVVVASQLNRQVEYRDDKHPVIADLRESGDIEQDADVVFLLHRPELYADTQVERDAVLGKLAVMMAKNRQLGTASSPVILQWVAEHFKYENAMRGGM